MYFSPSHSILVVFQLFLMFFKVFAEPKSHPPPLHVFFPPVPGAVGGLDAEIFALDFLGIEHRCAATLLISGYGSIYCADALGTVLIEHLIKEGIVGGISVVLVEVTYFSLYERGLMAEWQSLWDYIGWLCMMNLFTSIGEEVDGVAAEEPKLN